MTPKIAHEPLQRLLDYWNDKRAGRKAPARADIDPADIPALLPWIGLGEIVEDPPRVRARLLGSEVESLYGVTFHGQYLDQEDMNDHRVEILKEYATAIRTMEPVVGQWEFTKHDGRHIAYERIILPLSSDGETVDMLLAGWAFDKSWQ